MAGDRRCRVAAVQMTSTPRVEENLSDAERFLDEAASAGARLAVLPENFACMPHSESERLSIAEPEGDGPIQTFLSERARATGLWIVGGTIPLRMPDDEPRASASCLVYDDEGDLACRYDKIHLFDVSVEEEKGKKSYRESRYTCPGKTPVVVDTPAGRMGVAVCYDLRFSGLFLDLLGKGMEFAVLPAAFTAVTGRAHWEVLLRARAIENLIWVVASAQGGRHVNGRETHGDSMIVDPWGTVVARQREGTGCVITEIDLEKQAKTRRSFPALEHRTDF